jgi:ABC-type cobalamin/Fe3+-siderophores transport system ATPase subunit
VLVLQGGEVAAAGAPAATLTASLLREVFAVESLQLAAPGHALEIPWKAVENERP